MLRALRAQSPTRWREDHTRLAGTFGRWRAALEAGLPADARWDDAAWQEFRVCEVYHRLCAQPQLSLPEALHACVQACDQGTTVARRWAQMLLQAGQDAGAAVLALLGDRLRESTEDAEDAVPALTLLLANPAAGSEIRALALAVRGREHCTRGRYEDLPGDYSAAVQLNPGLGRAHAGRASTYAMLEDFGAALADFDRAIALNPLYARAFANRGYVHRIDRALDIEPAYGAALACRAQAHRRAGDLGSARADLARALRLDPASAAARHEDAVLATVCGSAGAAEA
jgi:tetratricopeptide (TPR) repeat protein